jgi:hypothetical protein
MKRFPVPVRAALLSAMLVISACQICPRIPELAQAPVPTHHDLTTQKKMQAVEHWKLLAEEVAAEVKEQVRKSLYINRGIYVAPSGTTEFEKNFRQLLISSLVRENLNVTNRQGDHLILSFSVDLVRHSKRLVRTPGGTYQAVIPSEQVEERASEVVVRSYDSALSRTETCVCLEQRRCPTGCGPYTTAAVEAGRYTQVLPRTEVLVATSLMCNGDYIYQDASAYYINHCDAHQYTGQNQYTETANEYYLVGE